MNRWTGMGRLVRDPDVRFTETSGKCVTRFVLAINYMANGKEHAEFVNCEAWEKLAETIGEFCGCGDKILVEGRLCTRKYEKDGENRFFTYISVSHMEFCEKRGKNKPSPADSLGEAVPTDPWSDTDADDIPF